MSVLLPSGNVSAAEDLRRAIHPDQVDENGEPTSAAFSTIDMSVDVASLASLDETRRRFPKKRVAIFPCQAVITLGVNPIHDPLPDNSSHAIVPGRLSRGNARKLQSAVKAVIDSLESGHA